MEKQTEKGRNNKGKRAVSPRAAAYALLCRMDRDASYSNIAIDAVIRREKFNENDRSFFTALVYGVVERKITLDYYINSFSTLPPDKISCEIRNILRLGAYQLLYLDRVPTHSAVDESVRLCGKNKGAAGFVNALLRKIDGSRESLPMPDPNKKPYRYLAIKYSFSISLCRRLCEIYGIEKCERILAAFGREKKTVLRVNTLRTTREALSKKLTDHGALVSNGRYSDTALLIDGGKMPDLANPDGEFFVQGEASQICAKVLDAKEGHTVIDMCSAPGSKSFGAAIDMKNIGRMISFDLHSSKLPLIEKGASRLGIGIITVKEGDGTVFRPEYEGVADRVICDVPCSGYGVCGKKPELRYKDIDESSELPAIQLEIAKNGARYLKAGGVMVYSTCTLLPEENLENVRHLLSVFPDLELEPFDIFGLCAKEGYITLTPDEHSTDGFFMAKLRKKI